MKAFYTKKGITSIEELGVEYARNLVSFHIVQDTISQEKFIEQEGTLSKKRFPMTSFRCLSAVLKMAAVVCNQSI